MKSVIAKDYRYLRSAIIRIHQHLGTPGNTPIEQAEAPWLAVQLASLRTVQQSYQLHFAAQGTVVP